MRDPIPYREVIELRSTGLSQQKVAYLCGVSEGKVSSITSRASALGLGWPVPIELTDSELARLVDPHELSRKARPDFADIEGVLGRKLCVDDAGEAYGIYLGQFPEDEGGPYAASTFRKMLRDWIAYRERKPVMRVNWFPGESVQVDWAGRKIPIHKGDVMTPASLFVATSPYSDFTFVRASLDMGMLAWLEHHVALFSFLGGVPLFACPDNLATGVTFARDGSRSVNERYRDLADHYGFIVVPARVRTATDKAAVEGHVRIMANRIVGTLAQMRFTSIEQLNASIAELVEVYNDRPSAALGWRSRREVFEAEESACLQPLPDRPYAPSIWQKVKAAGDAVVRVRGNYYGVPESFAGARLQAKVGPDTVSVYTYDRRQCVARHVRREDGSETFDGLPGVAPERFRPLDEWCEENGRTALLAQWDSEANGELTAHDVVCRSLVKVAWKCPECGFSWREAPARRTKRGFDDCLACAGVALVPGRNDLATTHPGIAAEWHPTKNPFPASQAFSDFGQQVWWLGACGHEWMAPIAKRTGSAEGALCPYCSGRKALAGFNDVATLAPELAAKWHPSKNRNAGPESTSVCASREVYLWDGPLSHIWRETPRKWLERNGMADVLAPFDAVVDAARAADAGRPSDVREAMERGKSSVKWIRWLGQQGLNMTLREWCTAFRRDDIAFEWDIERNGGATPDDVSRASTMRAWWKGPCGHVYQMGVRERTFRDNGCPYCAHVRVLAGFNSAECLSASIPKFWHPEKNGGLTPDAVSDRTAKRIWFQCPDCGYEWQESLRLTHEAARRCPACNPGRARYDVPGANDLAAVRPDVSRQWHPTLNGDLRPEDVRPGSTKRVWWTGACGHVWREPVSRRSPRVDDSCPFCANRKLLAGFNDLETRCPDAATEWDRVRNGGLTPSQVRFNESRKVWWTGSCGHSWEASPADRAAGMGCPYCSNHRVVPGENDLATRFPEIAAQWHPGLNGGMSPETVAFGSGAKAWWRCELGHEWLQPVYQRTSHDLGCPYCGGRKVLAGFNDLATTHPELARQWDADRNGCAAAEVMANRCASSWWICERGHSFRTPVVNRTRDAGRDPGCPYCAGRRCLAGFNDLATTHPELAATWYQPHNGMLTPRDVTAGSGKTVWWRGLECSHVFDMPVYQRAAAKLGYCPYCAGRRIPERPIAGL